MSSLNQVTLIGNLGADPENRAFPNGGQITNLRIATSESWKDRETGEKKEKTEWHTVTIKNDGLAGVAAQYLSKGSKVLVQGKLETRKWQDQEGNDRYSTEVVLSGPQAKMIMLGDKPSGGSTNSTPASANNAPPADLDDDIPF
jgi:single-strand DNA-binding protein